MQLYHTEVMYRMRDGSTIMKKDIEDAFHIVTGMRHRYDWESGTYTNDREYIKFLNGLFGKTIIEYFVPDIDDLIVKGERVRAIMVYRAEKKCSLVEAKEYIDLRTIELKEKKRTP